MNAGLIICAAIGFATVIALGITLAWSQNVCAEDERRRR